MNTTPQWSKEARIIAVVGMILAFLTLAWYFQGILNALVTAAIFAYILHPVVDFLKSRTSLSHAWAVNVVYISSLLLVAALIAWLTPVLVNQIQAIELDIESLQSYYQSYLATPITLNGHTILPGEFLPEIPQDSTDWLAPVMENLLTIVEVVTRNFIWIMIILVSAYYFLLDGHRLQPIIVHLAPKAYHSDVHHLYEQLRHVWSDYLRSQLVFMFIVGLVDSIVWLLIGLPGAIILGFLTGVTSFVHEIGAIVSGILSVLAALIGGSTYLPLSNFWFAVLVFLLYMVLTAVKNIWIRPIVVGRHVHLHSGVVFVVVIAALIFHGPLAAFLIVPVLVSLLVIGRYLRRRILGLPPFPEGQDPSQYFSVSLSRVESEGE